MFPLTNGYGFCCCCPFGSLRQMRFLFFVISSTTLLTKHLVFYMKKNKMKLATRVTCSWHGDLFSAALLLLWVPKSETVLCIGGCGHILS